MINGNKKDPKMEVLYVSTIFLAIFCDIPWNFGLKNRPYIYMDIYGRYLQCRFLNGHWNMEIMFPISSMYGIFTNIYTINVPNVGRYTIHGGYNVKYFFTVPIRKHESTGGLKQIQVKRHHVKAVIHPEWGEDTLRCVEPPVLKLTDCSRGARCDPVAFQP